MKNMPKISSLIDKAVFDYELIKNGDKILIGASGGKDSTALIEYFGMRLKRPDCGFKVKALNIQSDFAPPFPAEIRKFIEDSGVPFESINVDVLKRVKENQKMSCWWCSTQRRTELLNYALANGFNKIALGHHLDDILETFLMNMTEKGNISTMVPKMKYNKWPVEIIRPLCYISESRLVEHAKKCGYYGFTCTCNFQDNSTRKSAREKLEFLTSGNEKIKQRMFNALKNVQLEYLP